ncbi:MAG: hypothetical protein M1479_07865 [Actinobacteria bacterium]|nr:hypothetical protein [Cyanobacteriota bacterium]MCL5772175.1 hypothetical protein [Actinomycetota bacterium]
MANTRVEAGICGFVTEIEASSEDMQHVSLKVKTDCEKINNLGQKLTTYDAYNEIKEGFNGELFKVIREELKGCCAGCAVPVGLFKSMQVAAMVALPKNISITITK